jgi:hypothetical protein
MKNIEIGKYYWTFNNMVEGKPFQVKITGERKDFPYWDWINPTFKLYNTDNENENIFRRWQTIADSMLFENIKDCYPEMLKKAKTWKDNAEHNLKRYEKIIKNLEAVCREK